MTASHRTKAPREAQLDWTITATLVVSAVLAGLLGYWWMGPTAAASPDDLRFEPITVDRAKLSAQRRQAFEGVDRQRLSRNAGPLLQTARRLNRGQFNPDAAPTDLATLGATLRVQANAVIPATGFDGFVAAGKPLLGRCARGLDVLLRAIRSDRLSIEDALSNPPADKFGAYRQNCGNVLGLLIDRGLVDRHGRWSSDHGPIIADLLNRYRWAQIIGNQHPARLQLTRYGNTLLGRWRVEEAAGYTPAKRQHFLDQLAAAVPSYDARRAGAILAFKRHDYARALVAFEALAQSHPDQDYGRYVDYLRPKVTRATTATRRSTGVDDAAGSRAQKRH